MRPDTAGVSIVWRRQRPSVNTMSTERTEMTESMRFVGVHLLWPAVAANVVSGKDGFQKTTMWGGVPRARWSSPSQKRPTRLAFGARLDPANRSVRTRCWDQAAARLVADHGWEADAAEAVCKKIWTIATGGTEGKALVLARADIIDRMVESCAAETDRARLVAAAAPAPKKPRKGADEDTVEAYERAIAARQAGTAVLDRIAQDLFDTPKNVDIVFNGRMMADAPTWRVDAVTRIADAVSVDPWYETENIDYFIAVDDLTGSADLDNGESVKAGHLGSRSSGTNLFYRYACVDTRALANQTGAGAADVAQWTRWWIESFIHAKPARRQNSTAPYADPVFIGAHATVAPQTMPEFCARPITGQRQYQIAVDRLLGHYAQNQAVFGRDAVLHYWTGIDEVTGPEHTQSHHTLAAVLDHVIGTGIDE